MKVTAKKMVINSGKSKIIDLLNQMTIEEKIGQLTQMTGEHYVGRIDGEMVELGQSSQRI